ncbi:phosphatase PAP2 family protein [Streptomyces sp. NPDC048639]|uniref:phosphatase PAP2 family protein n=1 Tax=Streptomyces sp. NPDC048639 TaxID=3365581 RepID=UPI0037204510
MLPVLCGVLFALLTWQVAAGGWLVALDERVGYQLFRPGTAHPLAELAADLGNTQIALIALVAAMGFSVWRGLRMRLRRWWLPPLTAAAAMASVPALVVPLKDLIGRPGPLGPAENYGWYPSGHAATATIAYGAAALLLAPALRRALARLLLAGAALLLNLLVGAGLIRCGYHWPIDVLGSWLLFGGLLCALCVPAMRRPSAPWHAPAAGGSATSRSPARSGPSP